MQPGAATTASSSPSDEELLRWSPRASRSRRSPSPARPPPEAVADDVEHLFLELGRGRVAAATTARCGGCGMLHQAIVDREEQGETLSPAPARRPGREAPRATAGTSARRERSSHRADVRHPRLLDDRRADADPTDLAAQLNEHRAAMNRAILGEGGTVMQFVGDAVMAVFGAPVPAGRPRRPGARRRATAMHERAATSSTSVWRDERRGRLRPRHRPVDRRGRGRAPRLGGAARVHRSSATR